MNRIVILGATAAMIQSTLRRFAETGASFFLVARDRAKADAVAADLAVRGAQSASVMTADLGDPASAETILQNALSMGAPDLVIAAYGSLPDAAQARTDAAYARRELDTNFTSAAIHCEAWARYFEEQGKGHIAVITSVAGDRGRKSNYLYGAAKGALSIYLSGLRNRLHGRGVRVTTIKPGFVDTPMTRAFRKGPLFASAEDAGQAIYRAIISNRDIVYVPWFWRYIMLIIRLIPERIFKRLSL